MFEAIGISRCELIINGNVYSFLVILERLGLGVGSRVLAYVC